MNLKNILWVRNTGDIVPKAPIGDNLFGLKLSGDSGVITTATGNPISIITNKAQNAISTILSYSPKQSGSGDPSPQNIRPIEGWTEASLTGTGKNLYGTETLFRANYNITVSGGQTSNANYDIYKVEKIGAITGVFSWNESEVGLNNATFRVAAYNSDDTLISVVGGYYSYSESGRVTNFNITIPKADYYLVARRKTTSNVQLEVGTQSTAYEPYITPTETTISLGGTYYGFSIDVERGVLRVDTEYHTLDGIDESWIIQGQGDRRLFRLNLSTEGYRSGIAICDQYTRVSIRTDNTDIGFNLAFSANQYHFRFRPEYISDMNIDDWKAILRNQPVHVVIYKDTPIELPITPQTVALLAGSNTLWTDGDEVTLTYKAKK